MIVSWGVSCFHGGAVELNGVFLVTMLGLPLMFFDDNAPGRSDKEQRCNGLK